MPESQSFSEIRPPAVAGRFYPADAATLDREVRGFLEAGAVAERVEARMIMVPHAGYIYSGAIAGRAFAKVLPRPRAVVLCPNHTGLGVPRSISPARAWALPGGDLPADAALRELLIEHAELVAEPRAHLREHAAEVELPFLRATADALRFAAVCLSRMSFPDCLRVGKGIARAVRAASAAWRDEILIVASTDMSHYVSAEEAREKDALALARLQALDPEGLFRTVEKHHISMCGYIPTTVALVAALELGATEAHIVAYGNSGEISGDMTHVVGYASGYFA
jgi:AmmeMemoRadiSam system protein B